MHLEELGRILKNRRELLNITQSDLAELSDTGLRTIKAIENCKVNPTLDTLSKIIVVLGMELRLEVKTNLRLNENR